MLSASPAPAGRISAIPLSSDLRAEQLGDLLPFDRGLAAGVELAQELLMQGAQRRVVLRQLVAGVLFDQEDQPGDAGVLGEAELERAAEQLRHVERRVH